MGRIEREAVHAVLDALKQNGDAHTLDRAKALVDMLRPARFTREDVEKAARKIEDVMGPIFGSPEYLADPVKLARAEKRRRDSAIAYATAALSAIGDVDHG